MRGSSGETLATIPLPENIVCRVQSRLPPFMSICPALKHQVAVLIAFELERKTGRDVPPLRKERPRSHKRLSATND
jgi:hypothetical protein